MSLLTIAQNVADRVGLREISSVVGSGAQDARLLKAYINEAGQDLARFPWKALQKEETFQLRAGVGKYPLPEDFRSFLGGTFWDRAESRPMSNASPEQWQEFKSGYLSVAVYKRWRVRADQGELKLFIDPTPDADQVEFEYRDGTYTPLGVVYEYHSRNWVSGGKDAMTADSDTALLDEDLLELGTKYRLLEYLGRPWEMAYNDYKRRLDIAKSQEGSDKILCADSTDSLRSPNIPETGVGQ